jgi:hypothetical protein
MLDPSVDVGADMDALNGGSFTRNGEDFIVNGRTYGQHPETGRMFPKSGSGTHQLDRAEHGFLKLLNEKGQEYAENFARNQGVPEEKMRRVLELWSRCRN